MSGAVERLPAVGAPLALPDPQMMALSQVRNDVVPMAAAARAFIRESGDIDAARELARRLQAFHGYLRDREGRDLLAAEVRRTEVLIGHLLGPAVVGANQHDEGLHACNPSIGKFDRARFRTLADNEPRVEELLAQGFVTRRVLLDKLKAGVTVPSSTPQGKFRTIIADPPWQYGNSATRAAAEDHYPTLSTAQLCGVDAMPDGSKLNDLVREWSDDDAHLYMWTTAGFLRDSFAVMDSWGFEYKTFIAWVKPKIGMGNYFRVSAELILFGVRGRLPIEDRSLRNWFEKPRGKHSAKPEYFYDELVTKASPGPYLEMFARCRADTQLPGMCRCSKCLRGWDVWGNET